jgi:hypothetical protein
LLTILSRADGDPGIAAFKNWICTDAKASVADVACWHISSIRGHTRDGSSQMLSRRRADVTRPALLTQSGHGFDVREKGHVTPFTANECANYFTNAGYAST